MSSKPSKLIEHSNPVIILVIYKHLESVQAVKRESSSVCSHAVNAPVVSALIFLNYPKQRCFIRAVGILMLWQQGNVRKACKLVNIVDHLASFHRLAAVSNISCHYTGLRSSFRSSSGAPGMSGGKVNWYFL